MPVAPFGGGVPDPVLLITDIQTPVSVSGESGETGFVLEHLVKGGPVQMPATDEDGGDLGGVVDVLQRICVEEHQVCGLPDLYCAHILFPPKVEGWVDGGGLQGLQWSQPAFHHKRQFIMQPKARKCVGVGGIGARQNFDS